MAQHNVTFTMRNVTFKGFVSEINIIGDESRTHTPLLHGFDRICLGGLQTNTFATVNKLVNAVVRADRVGDFELYRLTTPRPEVVNSTKKWLDTLRHYPEGALNDDEADVLGTVSLVSVLPHRIIALLRHPEQYRPNESELYLVVLRGDYFIPPVPAYRYQ